MKRENENELKSNLANNHEYKYYTKFSGFVIGSSNRSKYEKAIIKINKNNNSPLRMSIEHLRNH